jgi:hypothetical protein
MSRNSITSETLAAELVARGALSEPVTPLPARASERPWFISLLLGAAGWLAGIFVVVLIEALFHPGEGTGFGIFAVVLLPAAFGLYFADRHNAFFDQLALALSIAGQIAATVAIADATKSAAMTSGAVAILQCLLLAVMPNALARSIAAFFACIAWALAIRFAWWGEESWGRARPPAALIPALIGWFVIWTPVAAAFFAALASESRWMASKARQIVRPALSGMLLALTFGTLASVPLEMIAPLWNSESGAQSNWLVLWPLLNVAAALVAGFGAFSLRNMALLGTAIAGALVHVVQFYYVLGTTLLLKSAIMLVMGALLLGAGTLLRRRSEQPEVAT